MAETVFLLLSGGNHSNPAARQRNPATHASIIRQTNCPSTLVMIRESLNDTKIVLGSKIALLYTRENFDGYNCSPNVGNHYQASDSDKHLSGMLSFTAGLVKKNDQGGNFFILGSVNIANDVSSIKNPRCSTGQDCNDATYVATVTPAHLERQTTISPSIKIGYKKTF